MINKITKDFLKLPNNKKLLVIVGPTASGKTKLALKLAKKYDGELVSADSRQIYRGLDIGTGKDLSANSIPIKSGRNSKLATEIRKKIKENINIGIYRINKVILWGLDLINPDREFSVAQWVEWAKIVINDIQSKDKLAIVVGGTGFWIKALIWGIEWGRVPRNLEFRIQNLELTIKQLQEKLRQYDKKFGQKLSTSDWLNKRRLIRRIEIAEYLKKHPKAKAAIEGIDKSIKVETIILGSMIYDLRSKIEKRIRKRLKQGLLREIKQLLAKGYSFKDPGMNSLGYKEFKDYFEDGHNHKELLQQAIIKWQKDEIDYARRQGLFIRKYLVNQ